MKVLKYLHHTVPENILRSSLGAPGATRIGLIDDVTDPKAHPQRQEIEATGRTLEIEIVPAEVRTAADIDAAYQSLISAGVQAVVVEQSNMLIFASPPIAQAAASNKLPTIYGYREHVQAGAFSATALI